MPNTKTRRAWTVADAEEIYQVPAWSGGYYAVSEDGNMVVRPQGAEGPSIDLRALVEEVRRRGIDPPLVLRFTDVLRSRIGELHAAFARAKEEYDYRGAYRGVYPIKVNQDRWVVEPIAKLSQEHHYGLEAGTKPELLAVMALQEDESALVVCNGYKDEEYVEAALMAQKLGRTIILVVEKLSEVELIADTAKRLGVEPVLGVRVKLSSRGSGRWKQSGGDRAKFGLASHEVIEALDELRARDMLGSLQMLHFHLGSQISAIRSIKDGLQEAIRFFVELHRLGAPLRYLDVGGGLGIDYDGSQTNFSSSMNYTLQEYANDIVYYTAMGCDAAGIEHPTLVSESGRAVVAHHAVLVCEVLGVTRMVPDSPPDSLMEGAHPVLRTLLELVREVNRKNFLEVYHDAVYNKEQVLSLFSLGHLSLEQRVAAESLFWTLCARILKLAREQNEMPEELEDLEGQLADIYFCNFSLFQSLPDAWAVDQLFPVVPLHRLNNRPARRAVLADITCDSDGKLDRFIDRRDVREVLPVHELGDEPYYLGIFLVGAYQESLGDFHNLFGKINALSVSVTEEGYRIEHVEPGDTVREVLRVAGYQRDDLVARVRRASEDALADGRITLDDARQLVRFYQEGLAGYTYLERE